MTSQWQPLTTSGPQSLRRPGSAFFNLRRKRRLDLRQVMDAILWLLRTGCQWRNLPDQWPHWQAVYYYFDCWKKAGLFEQLNARLNQLDRQQQGRNPNPSALRIDSQSIKTSPMVCEF